MEKEILEALLAAIEAQKAEIAELRALVEANDGGIDGLLDTLYEQNDQEGYDAFKERHGSKFAPIVNSIKLINGEDFDPVRSIYDMTGEASEAEGYNEDEFVGAILAEAIETLNKLKAVLPEAAVPAVEEAEQAVQEAAIVAESPAEEAPAAEGAVAESPEAAISEEGAEQTDADSDSPEDDEKMLQEAWEKSSGRGYVSR